MRRFRSFLVLSRAAANLASSTRGSSTPRADDGMMSDVAAPAADDDVEDKGTERRDRPPKLSLSRGGVLLGAEGAPDVAEDGEGVMEGAAVTPLAAVDVAAIVGTDVDAVSTASNRSFIRGTIPKGLADVAWARAALAPLSVGGWTGKLGNWPRVHLNGGCDSAYTSRSSASTPSSSIASVMSFFFGGGVE